MAARTNMLTTHRKPQDGNPNAARAKTEEGEAEDEEPLDLYGEVMVVDQPIGAWERITSRMVSSKRRSPALTIKLARPRLPLAYPHTCLDVDPRLRVRSSRR